MSVVQRMANLSTTDFDLSNITYGSEVLYNLGYYMKSIAEEAERINTEEKIDIIKKLISFTDLTSLNATDSFETVKKLIDRATQPLALSLLNDSETCCASVCIYPYYVKDAVAFRNFACALGRSFVSIVTVAGAFPSGMYKLITKVHECREAKEDGADEIDVVINRGLVATRNWRELYKELVAMRKEIASPILMKTILSTGDIASPMDIYAAATVAMMAGMFSLSFLFLSNAIYKSWCFFFFAGSSFIKSSTGKEKLNSTVPGSLVICLAIRSFFLRYKRQVGFKAAGGIKTAQEAIVYYVLVKQILGERWLSKEYFRIGASELLDDLVRTLEKLQFGKESSSYLHDAREMQHHRPTFFERLVRLIIDNGYYRGPKIVANSVNDIIEDKNALLIDICGGTGSTALELRKYGFQNIDCIDACEGMLEIAKQKSAYSNCICELLLPGKQSTLNAEKYDCVFCVGSFAPGHLQPEVVDEFIRILKNEGYCVIGMREEWLYTADDYRDKLEPYMFKLKKWRLIKRERFENWFENHSGIVYIFKKC
ncbi:putative deoxyribose-phosphate aldolase [Trichinella murrelli]|uniref:deoxyribose-phosphate aldolase n=1 Tax=Trichinella murrelli TaxID=144512 RepID=A0A0V0U4I2_9BILA|nr:putative deoxyribose-phosphate aldolase [Trichinella murrelli]